MSERSTHRLVLSVCFHDLFVNFFEDVSSLKDAHLLDERFNYNRKFKFNFSVSVLFNHRILITLHATITSFKNTLDFFGIK